RLCGDALLEPQTRPRAPTLPDGAGALPARIRRPRRQPLSLYRAARGDDPRRRCTRRKSKLPARRCDRHHPADPRLYGLGLLGVPRQGRHTRIPLMSLAARRLKQFGWMIAIWAMSVAALGVVAAILRFWL